MTDGAVGQALTVELKADLAEALGAFARGWLAGVAAELAAEASA